jgi:hypothetical protein
VSAVGQRVDVAGLGELPVSTVVLDAEQVAWQRQPDGWWCAASYDNPSNHALGRFSPFLILWLPA